MVRTVNVEVKCSSKGCERKDTLPAWNNRCIEHSPLAHMLSDIEGMDALSRFPQGLSPPEAHLYCVLMRRVDGPDGDKAPAWVFATLIKLIDIAMGRHTTAVNVKEIFDKMEE